jgi:UDP-GlcNAc:undecaprenyl-phosphate/decaprenyl-phosphate GlcNAc-1-phosphate transferase
MLINSILLDYWFLAPTVSLACEALRWLSKSLLGILQEERHWIHVDETPRVGGICIFLALLVSSLLSLDMTVPENQMLVYFVALIPIFATGFIEDIVGGVSALTRLIFTSSFVTVACGFIFYSHGISEQNHSFFFLMPFLFVCLCLTGVGLIHGTNLIDGLNGLAVFWGIGAAIAIWVCVLNSPSYSPAEKEFVSKITVIFCLCLIGFFFVNFPFGRVFLGDSGAYLIGSSVFVLGAILIMRSPDSQTILKISAACSYPLMELGWTVSRRALIDKKSLFSADNAHLHSFIYANIKRRFSALSVRSANNCASIVTFLFVMQITFWVSVMLPADFWAACLVWLFCPASYVMVYFLAVYRGVSSDTR